MNLSRLTQNHTVSFLKFLLGMRSPYTSVSERERRYLLDLARGKRCLVEVGVYEAATSQAFCQEMDPAGTLYLIDPFFPMVRLERLLNLSFTRHVAVSAVRRWQSQVRFIREPSHVAATILPLQDRADFIFIDARHDYDSVLQDFQCWAPMLRHDCVMAFHDSRQCPARPEIGAYDGPVRLMREISEGKHGAWEPIGNAESVTAIRRRGVAAGATASTARTVS